NSRITLDGVISSGSGMSSLYFEGTADSSGFNLRGANTFTGNLLVASGTLGIASDANLGNAAHVRTLSTPFAQSGGLHFLHDGPAGTNVTVSAGAEFNTGGLSNLAATAIGTLTLNGGTFRVPNGGGDYYLNQLATGSTGGAVDFTGSSNFWLHLTGVGASIT